tara:strand:- start:969 stop:1166 length:198 start_codon:yes stop_codon:yes gene_type:complete
LAGFKDTRHQPQQGGFACPVATHNAQGFTFQHLQRDVIEHVMHTVIKTLLAHQVVMGNAHQLQHG